jgi:ABC-type Zn2+ transport system substrate-binding protein/surface adhesin
MKKQQSLIDRIKATLKIGDEGKVQNFIGKQISKLEREIKSIKQNISILENEYSNKIADFADQTQDAEQAVIDAYEAITIEELKNNASTDEFAKKYWFNIEECERSFKRLEKAIEDYKESYSTKLENFEEQIAERERRISNLS